jgi:hypothetical protein
MGRSKNNRLEHALPMRPISREFGLETLFLCYAGRYEINKTRSLLKTLTALIKERPGLSRIFETRLSSESWKEQKLTSL